MELTQIRVVRLFGMFDHRVDLKSSEHITIMTAPNGFGKTVILRLTSAFFDGRFFEFFRTSFKEFGLTFDNGSSILIQKEGVDRQTPLFEENEPTQEEEEIRTNVEVILISPKSEPQSWKVSARPRLASALIDRYVPGLERVGPRAWLDVRTGRRMSFEEVSLTYADFLPESVYREPEWLATFRSALSCRFIETQRLLRVAQPNAPRRTRDHPDDVLRPVVSELAAELAGAINLKLREYGALAQSRDSTFPQRLISQVGKINLSEPELRRRLADLDRERAKFMEAGLLDRDETLKLTDDAFSQTILDVLPIYIDDTEQKLRIFNETYQKINTLKQIVNDRFQYKQIYIDNQRGLGVKLFDGSELSLDNLSSGEQHELVLMYELLFKVAPRSLILIDEPELSLHVAWQKRFIADLSSIIELSGFSAVIATHSPQIIDSRWDLTVNLSGPVT